MEFGMLGESSASVLLVDPDPAIGRDVRGILAEEHYAVEWVDDGEKAFNRLDSRLFDVLVSELHVRRVDGMRLMAVARERNPDVCVIFIAGRPDIELAVEAMRQGAYDFQTKPLNVAKLGAVVQRGLAHQRLVLERYELKRRLDEEYGLGSLVGKSRPMMRVYTQVRQVAPENTTVLIQGESGTGKDLIAQAIHNASPRRDEAFVQVDCSGPGGLHVGRELFGYVQGAFPGAARARVGRAELADKGTLYLDDVGELSPKLQESLVDLIKHRRFSRLGGGRKVRADVRVIAATTHPLAAMPVHQDLRVLLEAVTIDAPPLRDRTGDVPLLIQHFVRRICQRSGMDEPGISQSGLGLLTRYEWPGNIRELRDAVEEMVAGARGRVLLDITDVPARIRGSVRPRADDVRIPAGSSMKEVERIVIEETLDACGYNREACAKVLGIGLRTLYRKLKEYGAR